MLAARAVLIGWWHNFFQMDCIKAGDSVIIIQTKAAMGTGYIQRVNVSKEPSWTKKRIVTGQRSGIFVKWEMI
jgi:hypothetical protein